MDADAPQGSQWVINQTFVFDENGSPIRDTTIWMPLETAVPTSSLGAYMIRPHVNFERTSAEGLKLPLPKPVSHEIYRMNDEQTNLNIEDWDKLATLEAEATTYTDAGWADLEQMGYYYAVRTEYANNKWSRPILTNILGKNTEFSYTVNVTNNAGNDVEGAVVTLTEEEGGKNHSYSQVAETGTVNFPMAWLGIYNLSVTQPGFEPYYEEGVLIEEHGTESDANLTEIVVDPFNLKVDMVGANDANLTWNNASDDFVDDIESYADFIMADIGEYVLHDVDTQPTYPLTMSSGELYGFPNNGGRKSYMVFNPRTTKPALDADSTVSSAHSGTKFLIVQAAQRQNNDWLILPKKWISKGSQLRLWASSLNEQYIERFKIAVSTTGTEPEDFTVISKGDYVSVPPVWTEFAFDMSVYMGQEVHVALVGVSEDAFMLMIDDIFLGVGDPDAENPNERPHTFNVYLNDEKVDAEYGDTERLFEDLEDGEYTAAVEAIYGSGITEKVTKVFTINEASIKVENTESFKVYPNPVTDVLNIQTSATIREITVMDLTGKVMMTLQGDRQTVDMQSLPIGNYVVRIQTENGITPIKIVKK
jgi:hypothetical protein